MKIFLAAAILAFGLSTASARIGENLEQCVARYGKPVSIEQPKKDGPPMAAYIFEKNGFSISIRFVGGVAAQMIFTRHGLITTTSTVEAILEASAQGSTWEIDAAKTEQERSPVVQKETFYKRKDGGATADYVEVGDLCDLAISTPAFKKANAHDAAGL